MKPYTLSLYETGKLTKVVTNVPESESVQLPQPTEAEWLVMEEQIRRMFPLFRPSSTATPTSET